MEMKYLLASHVGEFNGEAGAEILWHGDGDEVATLPNVRTLTVAAIRDLSPHIRRITFASSKLKRFDRSIRIGAPTRVFPRTIIWPWPIGDWEMHRVEGWSADP